MYRRLNERDAGERREYPGIILMITLVILVILATLGYTLTARVAARRHRDRYIMDCGQAKHACISALKCVLASAGDLEPLLISRPNEPDFSDVFAMNDVEYQEFLAEFAARLAAQDGNAVTSQWVQDDLDAGNAEDVKDVNDANDTEASAWKPPPIPGPYGPPWPLVTQPMECEIGSAHVTIEIEDENAKYPLGWALLTDEQWTAVAEAGLVTFCEWMGYLTEDIEALKEDLAHIGEIRPFKVEFKPVVTPVTPPASLRSRLGRTSGASRATPTSRTLTRKTISVADQIDQQNADFAQLFHSSLLDADLLMRPSIVSETRHESAMKYLGLWAARHVNVNTAPRHVLEAALTLGSVADAPKIAEEIIQQRRIKPFSNHDELKKAVLRYSDSIEKCKEFLVTASSVFTIKVTAVNGAATATAIAAIVKEGDKIKQIGVVAD